jgi:hypothetical protein
VLADRDAVLEEASYRRPRHLLTLWNACSLYSPFASTSTDGAPSWEHDAHDLAVGMLLDRPALGHLVHLALEEER